MDLNKMEAKLCKSYNGDLTVCENCPTKCENGVRILKEVTGTKKKYLKGRERDEFFEAAIKSPDPIGYVAIRRNITRQAASSAVSRYRKTCMKYQPDNRTVSKSDKQISFSSISKEKEALLRTLQEATKRLEEIEALEAALIPFGYGKH